LITFKIESDWLSQQHQFLLEADGGQLERSENLFNLALSIEEGNIQ
jgi:hypothetical protein